MRFHYGSHWWSLQWASVFVTGYVGGVVGRWTDELVALADANLSCVSCIECIFNSELLLCEIWTALEISITSRRMITENYDASRRSVVIEDLIPQL